MIIDAHAHISASDYGNVEILLDQFKASGVSRGFLFPGGMIDVRRMTKYITGQEQPVTLEIPNNLVEEACKKYPENFRGFFCVNPHKGDAVLAEFEDAVKNRGFVGLKLAPVVHQFSLTAPIVKDLAKLCGELNVPLYSHVVFSPAANTARFIHLAKSFPETRFILGHMGFGPADVDAVECAKSMDNLFFETSQGSHLIIGEAYRSLGASRIIFGSEFPMYHVSSALENVKMLPCTEGELELMLGKNINLVTGNPFTDLN